MLTVLLIFSMLTFWYNLRPDVEGYPIIGVIPTLLKMGQGGYSKWIHEVTDRLQLKTSRWSALTKSCVMTCDPENVRFVLHNQEFIKGPSFVQNFEELLGNGIFAVDGFAWRNQRKIVSHFFSTRNVTQQLHLVFLKHLRNLVNTLKERKSWQLDIQQLMFKTSFDSIVAALFGQTMTAPDNFCEAFDETNSICTSRFMTPSIIWRTARFFKIGQEGRLSKYVHILNTTIESACKRALVLNNDGVFDGCLLSLTSFSKAPLTAKFLRDFAVNFILAGRDTTGWATTVTLWQLSSNPRTLALARSFIDKESEITYASVARLPYIQAAVLETLRLHPSVPHDGKITLEDVVLPDGFPVFKNEMVGFSQYSMGRSSDIWGPNVNAFMPERFLECGKLVMPDASKYPVFVDGHRVCLGRTLALAQTTLLLSVLLREFDFDFHHIDLEFCESATMKLKNGAWATISHRDL